MTRTVHIPPAFVVPKVKGSPLPFSNNVYINGTRGAYAACYLMTMMMPQRMCSKGNYLSHVPQQCMNPMLHSNKYMTTSLPDKVPTKSESKSNPTKETATLFFYNYLKKCNMFLSHVDGQDILYQQYSDHDVAVINCSQNSLSNSTPPNHLRI